MPPCCFKDTTPSTRPPAWVWPISSASSLERKPPALEKAAGSPRLGTTFYPIRQAEFQRGKLALEGNLFDPRGTMRGGDF